jgi:hypothetical protein
MGLGTSSLHKAFFGKGRTPSFTQFSTVRKDNPSTSAMSSLVNGLKAFVMMELHRLTSIVCSSILFACLPRTADARSGTQRAKSVRPFATCSYSQRFQSSHSGASFGSVRAWPKRASRASLMASSSIWWLSGRKEIDANAGQRPGAKS